MEAFIEPTAQADCPDFPVIDADHPSASIDFCIALGGDGTVLHLNSLFQGRLLLLVCVTQILAGCRSIPPVFPLAMGSLGFLAPYKFPNYKTHLTRVLSALH